MPGCRCPRRRFLQPSAFKMPRVARRKRTRRKTTPKNNNLNITVAEKGAHRPSFKHSSVDVHAFFRPQHIVNAISKRILKAHFIVGNIAWLTNPDILQQLRRCKGVSLIINHDRALIKKHRVVYESLRPIDAAQKTAVRTVKGGGRALHHHKFCVFLGADLRPYACLTGSFNWTKQSTHNLEHIVCFDDAPELAARFMQEHLDVRKISKALRRVSTKL